ncbi:RluA family pseudouridine synthase [Thermaerobacter sp. FW80]|uniref:RluA family pseudouridine synthase n=1 Tax=Thermaerobacter sp. FW80 TaxID=2546351 RepID=UPI001074DC97|nr:RluA family pseudouridine synthase [Thermaerobacter sp. FW80]QBS36772.1 RluA family pseudouridine synthase [Thermaerobacter sp. FW80]
MRVRYVVTTADEGQRLHRLARRWLRDVPLSAVFRLLRQGRITVNGRRAPHNAVVRAGDVIEAELDATPSPSRPPVASPRVPRGRPDPPEAGSMAPLRQAGPPRRPDAPTIARPGRLGPGPAGDRTPAIVYEDPDILVVHKPAGLLTHGADHARRQEPTLVDWVREELARRGALPQGSLFQPSPAHRLDRNTSGLVAFGKTRRGAARLAAWLRSRQAVKEYVAVVSGRPPEGLVHHRLRRDRQRRLTLALEPSPRPGAAGTAPPQAAAPRAAAPRAGSADGGPGPGAWDAHRAGHGGRSAAGQWAGAPAGSGGAQGGRGARPDGDAGHDAGAQAAPLHDAGAQEAALRDAETREASLRVRVLDSRHGFSLCRIQLLTGRSHQIRAQLAATGHPLAGDAKYGGPRVEGLHRPALHGYRLVLPNGVDVVAPLPADLTRLCRRLGLSLRGIRTEG